MFNYTGKTALIAGASSALKCDRFKILSVVFPVQMMSVQIFRVFSFNSQPSLMTLSHGGL